MPASRPNGSRRSRERAVRQRLDTLGVVEASDVGRDECGRHEHARSVRVGRRAPPGEDGLLAVGAAAARGGGHGDDVHRRPVVDAATGRSSAALPKADVELRRPEAVLVLARRRAAPGARRGPESPRRPRTQRPRARSWGSTARGCCRSATPRRCSAHDALEVLVGERPGLREVLAPDRGEDELARRPRAPPSARRSPSASSACRRRAGPPTRSRTAPCRDRPPAASRRRSETDGHERDDARDQDEGRAPRARPVRSRANAGAPSRSEGSRGAFEIRSRHVNYALRR